MRTLARSVAACSLVLLVAQPSVAHAGNAGGKLRGYFDYLVYTAIVGETNDVTVSGSGGTYTVHDTAGVTAGADCSQLDPMTATCTEPPSYPFLGIQIHTLDRNDIVHASTDLDVTLNGGTGNDQLFGGNEPDQLVGGTGADVMSGGGGTDTADYSARTAPLDVTIDGNANDGESGEGDNVLTDVENLIGGAADDNLTGSTRKNVISGLGGDDYVQGIGAADSLNGDDGSDGILAGGGPDSVYGGTGNDFLNGDGGDDTIYGGLGDNTLRGAPGDDTLYSNGDTTTDTDVCGTGSDSATVDAHDTVSTDCETVTVA